MSTAPTESSRLAASQQRIDEVPFHTLLRPQVVSVSDSCLKMRLAYQPSLARSKEVCQFHGGVIAALVDIAAHAAAADVGGRALPTIAMALDYLSAAVDTDLIAEAKVIKAGRMIIVVNVEIINDRGRIVAAGRASFIRSI